MNIKTTYTEKLSTTLPPSSQYLGAGNYKCFGFPFVKWVRGPSEANSEITTEVLEYPKSGTYKRCCRIKLTQLSVPIVTWVQGIMGKC